MLSSDSTGPAKEQAEAQRRKAAAEMKRRRRNAAVGCCEAWAKVTFETPVAGLHAPGFSMSRYGGEVGNSTVPAFGWYDRERATLVEQRLIEVTKTREHWKNLRRLLEWVYREGNQPDEFDEIGQWGKDRSENELTIFLNGLEAKAYAYHVRAYRTHQLAGAGYFAATAQSF